MSYHEPISVKTTHTDQNGQVIEKQFRSINQAGKFFSLNTKTLKELCLGRSPKFRKELPPNFTIEQIATLPKLIKVKIKHPLKDEKWHCDLCQVDLKPNSKYAHLLTEKHQKLTNNLNQPNESLISPPNSK